MTYVITELCTRDGACVEVCPVDCIVPGPKGEDTWPYFYIDPDICIDCGACVPVCPPEAIFAEWELPAEYNDDLQKNTDFFIDGPGYWDFDLEEQREQTA